MSESVVTPALGLKAYGWRPRREKEKGVCHKCMRMSGAYERRYETLDDLSGALMKIAETISSSYYINYLICSHLDGLLQEKKKITYKYL